MNGGRIFIESATVTAVGTDPIIFTTFEPGPFGTVTSITAGTGLTGGTITTSGTIALASPVVLANGGTSASLVASNGGIVYSTASALAILAAGATNQVLLGQGAGAPIFSTATYLPTVIANDILLAQLLM